MTSRLVNKGQAALQVFIFRGETFLGTELFDSSRPIMVGRHHDAQLQLDGDTVSRYHCRISSIGGQLFAEDLQSGNGTLVNRARVERRTELQHQDQVHIGPYSLRFKLLTAPGPRPFDPSKSEDTTKINAILAAERTGTLEVGVEVDGPSFNDALYRDAIRRSTGGERAQELPAVPAEAIDGDSTQMAADDVALHNSRAQAPVVMAPVAAEPSVVDDSKVEARLRDLDALIASLDAEDRGPSGLMSRGASLAAPQGVWPAENTAPTTTELDLEDAIFSPSTSGPVDTREFARDLASRLALDGQVVPEPVPAAPAAQIIPLHPEPRLPTPVPQAPLDEDEDPTEAEQLDPAVDLSLAAAAMLDDENPETDVFEGGVPPQIAPQILEASRATPVAPPPAAPVMERTRSFRDPAASGPARIPTKGLFIPRAPSPAAPLRDAMDVASTKPVSEPPTPAPPHLAQALPPPLPRKARTVHPARLMTPTSLRVDVTPMNREDESYDDVWTKGGTTPAPALKRAAPRRATEARPKSRMDDFSEAVQHLPNAPIPMHWDGIEVSARVQGKLVDISVLRSSKEEYILGHRTPQGAIAPASAHIGLRLVRINDDNTVDLVFPKDVGGHLVRGDSTVTFSQLAEGRKYSCLRLEARDVATVALGTGQEAITYHVRFLHRPMSLFRSLRGLRS